MINRSSRFFKRISRRQKKRFLFERKVFSLSQSARIRAAKIKKQNLVNDELRMFQSTIRFVQKNEFRLFRKNNLMTFVQFLRSTNSIKVFIAYKRKNRKMKFSDIYVLNDFKFDDDFTWKKNIIKKKIFQEFHRSICWVFHFEILWISKKNAIKI
jgi:hypothetical protein